jgi:hypothetical protein
MNLDKLVQRGRLPWSPTPAVTDLDVWHEYEVPLVGTYRLENQVVLFTVMGDPSEDFTVWAYRILSPGDVSALEDLQFESLDELRTYAHELFLHQPAVLALAGDLQIREWGPVRVDDGLLSAAVRFLKAIVEATAPDPLTAFRGAVAEVETVSPELVDV